MPSSMEIQYKKKLAAYQQLVAEHKDCIAKQYNAAGLFIRCLSCKTADPDDELQDAKFTNERQLNVCKTCGDNTLSPLVDDECSRCYDPDITVNDFEFGEAQEHWTSFEL